jgi:hypothetical protein
MIDIAEQAHSRWRQMEYEWYDARQAWRDSTTEFFAAHCWQQLERETMGYITALERLIEILRAAQQQAQR